MCGASSPLLLLLPPAAARLLLPGGGAGAGEGSGCVEAGAEVEGLEGGPDDATCCSAEDVDVDVDGWCEVGGSGGCVDVEGAAVEASLSDSRSCCGGRRGWTEG